MRRVFSATLLDRAAACCLPVLWLMTSLAAPGCRHESAIEFTSNTKPPTMRLIQPRVRNIVRVVGQPSFIESYERTSIYPKPTAYIGKWVVDIGDKVKKTTCSRLCSPRVGRAARHEEGGRRARPEANRAGQ